LGNNGKQFLSARVELLAEILETGFDLGDRALGLAGGGVGDEDGGANQAVDGLDAEGDGAEGRELGLEIKRARRQSGLSLQEAASGDAHDLDLSGEVGDGHPAEDAAFGLLEVGGVEAMFEGVVIARRGAAFGHFVAPFQRESSTRREHRYGRGFRHEGEGRSMTEELQTQMAQRYTKEKRRTMTEEASNTKGTKIH
jgi:hypothetical protein